MKIMVITILSVIFEMIKLSWAIAVGSLLTIKRVLAPPALKSLRNEVILVTGGSNGIGRNILLTIATMESDVTVISWGMNSAANVATIEKVKSLGVKRAMAMSVDVREPNQVAAAAAKVRQEFGDVTMLFNNAGIFGPIGRCWEVDLHHEQRTIQINFMSNFNTLREFLPAMIQKNSGHVIATCSLAGYAYAKDNASYCASKHAMSAYYNCLKQDLRDAASSVRVSLVYPGNIETNMSAPYDLSSKSLPILSKATSAASAGRQIVDGVLRCKENIYVPWHTRSLHITFGLLSSEAYSSALDFIGVSHRKRSS